MGLSKISSMGRSVTAPSGRALLQPKTLIEAVSGQLISEKFTLPAGASLVNETLQGSQQQILKFDPSQSTVMSTTITAPNTASWSAEAIFRTRAAGFGLQGTWLFGHGTSEGTRTIYTTNYGNSLNIERWFNYAGGYNPVNIPADNWIYFKLYNDIIWVYNISTGTWIANGEAVGAWDTLPSNSLNFWVGGNPFDTASNRADADIAMVRFSSPANIETPTGAPAYTMADATANDQLFIVPGTVAQLNVNTMTFDGGTTTLGAGAIAIDPTGTSVYQTSTTTQGIRNFTLTSPGNFLGGITQNADYTLGVWYSGIDGRTMGFKPNGLLLYVGGSFGANGVISTFSLPVAWPVAVTSAIPTQELSLNSLNEKAFSFKPDGTILYYIADNYSAQTVLRRYVFSTPWFYTNDASSSDYNLTADWPSAPFNQFHNYVFNRSGTKLYLLHGQQYISEYSLSTAWDTTTMTYTGVQQNLGALCGMTSFNTGNMILDQTRGKLWLQGRGSDLVEKLYQFDFGSGVGAAAYPTVNSADEAFKFTLDSSSTVYLPSDTSPNAWPTPGLSIDSGGYTSEAGNPFGTGGNYISSINSQGRIITLNSSAYTTWHNANLAQSAWSFECHINPLTVPSQPIGLFFSGVSEIRLNKPVGQNWRVTVQAASNSSAQGGGSLGIVDLGPDFTTGLWQHLVVVWARTGAGVGTLRAYVNGVLVGSKAVNLGFSLEFYAAAGATNIAGRPFGGTVSFYIDNIRMILGTPFPAAGFKAPRLPFSA